MADAPSNTIHMIQDGGLLIATLGSGKRALKFSSAI
jgi:hypothetical protein